MLKLGVCLLYMFAGYAVAQNHNLDVHELHQSGLREYREGHYVQAESLLRAALDGAGQDPAGRAQILTSLGNLLLDEERTSEAEVAFSKALDLARQLEDRQTTVLLLRELGALYSMQGKHDEAIALLKHALKAWQGSRDGYAPLLAEMRNSLGVAYFRQKKYRKAEQSFNQALAIAKIHDPRQVPSLLSNLGAVAQQREEFMRSENLLNDSLKLMEDRFGANHPALIQTLESLASLFTASNRYEEALKTYTRARSILEANALEFDARIARVEVGFAEIYLKAGNNKAAEEALGRAAIIARHNPSHADMPAILDTYALFLTNTGKTDEAQTLRAEAHRARITMTNTVRAYAAK